MMEAVVKRGSSNRIRMIVSAIGLAITAYAAGNIIALAFVLIFESIGIAVRGYPGRIAFVSAISLQAIGFGGIGLVYLKYVEHDRSLIRLESSWRRGIGYFVGGSVALLLGLAAISRVITWLGIDPAQSRVITNFKNPELLLVLIPISILIVGPAEELLFRGLVQGKIRRAIGPVGAITIASALFASIHVFGLKGSPKSMIATLIVIFVLSLILGSLYELSGSLIIPALVHGLYNAIQFYFKYVQVVG
jgi:membrane protease YdiL (CAAX protease family)